MFKLPFQTLVSDFPSIVLSVLGFVIPIILPEAMSSSLENQQPRGGKTPVSTPPGSPSTVWATPATHQSSLPDDEHSPASPAMARPSQTPPPSKQHKRFASLSNLNTNLSFRRPLPPRRSLPAHGSKPVHSLPDPPEPSPLTAILEGIAGASSSSDQHPSLLADGDVGVLDSADTATPLTAFESKAATFFMERQTAIEELWDDLESQPEEKRKAAQSEVLTSQMKMIDDCFKHFLQATKRVRELEEAQSLKTHAEENDRIKELKKLKNENKTLATDKAELSLELRDMRDKNRQLHADLKAREAALADSPAYDGPFDEGLMKLWLEDEASYYVTHQQQGAFADDRPSTHDSASNGDDESISMTPTLAKRRRAKRSFFGTDINPEMLEMMEEFVATRLAEQTSTPAQSVEEMKQQIRKLQSDLDDEKFQHRLVVEDWERITGEPITLEFYEKAAAKEPLPFLTKTINQLRDELAVAEERLAEEMRSAKNSDPDLQDRKLQLEKDLVTQKELLLRLQTKLDTWEHEFQSVEEARSEMHELKERNKEQAGYIQLRSDAWRHAEINEQASKERLAELEKELNDLQSKNEQFIERIVELEDHEKSLEAQLEDQTDRANKFDAYKTEADAKIGQFIERIEELEDQKKVLETQLQEHRDRANEVETGKAEVEARLATATTQLEELRPELDNQNNLQAQLDEAKRQLANTESDLRARRLKSSESRQRIEELEHQLAQFKELQDKERGLRRELADKDDELLTERLRNVDLSSEMRKLAGDLKTVQEDLENEQSKCADFIQRIEELEDEVNEQNTHIAELEVANADAKTMESQHLATIKGLEATIAGLQARIEHSSNTISLLMTKPPLGPKRIELLKRQTQTPRDLRKMVSRLMTQKKKYHHRWLRARQALGTAREDVARVVAQKDADTERERQLREQIASLETEYATTYASLVRAMAELGAIMEMDKPAADDTLDAVDDLPPSTPFTPYHTTTIYPPDPPTKKMTNVVHQHSEACFCTLVDYFLPGVLHHILPEPPTKDCTCCCDQDIDSHGENDTDSGYETHHGLPSTDSSQIAPGPEKENSPHRPISRKSHSPDPPPYLEPTQIDPGLEEEEEESIYDMPLRKVVTDPGPGFGYNHAYDYGLRVEDDEVRFEPYLVHNSEETTDVHVMFETEPERRYLTRSECREYGIEIESIQEEAPQAGQEGLESEQEYEEEQQPVVEEAEDQSVDAQCDAELINMQKGLSLRGGGLSEAGSSESDKETVELLFEEAQGTTTEEEKEQTSPTIKISAPQEAPTTNQASYLTVTPSRTRGMPSTFTTPMTGTTIFGEGDPDTVEPAFKDTIAETEQEHVVPSKIEDPFQHAADSQTRGHIDDTNLEHGHGDSNGKPNPLVALPPISQRSGQTTKVHFPRLSTDTITKDRTKYPKSPAVPNQANKNYACNCHTALSRRDYHGHTSPLYSSAGPFTKQTAVALICNFLTALLWLAFLILQTPGTFLSTSSVLAGYLFLPLGYIFAVGVYSIRQLTYRITPPFPTFRTTYAPPLIGRPSMPVMPRPSAHQIVTSVLFLMVAYLVIASEAVTAERIAWTTPNRFRAAYAADLLDHRPYPGWSPINVDYRLVVRDWCNALIFFRGGMGSFIQGINSIPTVVMHACGWCSHTFTQGITTIITTVLSAGTQLIQVYKTNIDGIGEWLEKLLDQILHILWFPFPVLGSWFTSALIWIIQTILLPFTILNFLKQTLLNHVHQLAAKHFQPGCLGGLTYLGECVIEYTRDRFEALGEWLELPLEVVDEWWGQ